MKQIFKFSRHRYPVTNYKSYPLIFYSLKKLHFYDKHHSQNRLHNFFK